MTPTTAMEELSSRRGIWVLVGPDVGLGMEVVGFTGEREREREKCGSRFGGGGLGG